MSAIRDTNSNRPVEPGQIQLSPESVSKMGRNQVKKTPLNKEGAAFKIGRIASPAIQVRNKTEQTKEPIKGSEVQGLLNELEEKLQGHALPGDDGSAVSTIDDILAALTPEVKPDLDREADVLIKDLTEAYTTGTHEKGTDFKLQFEISRKHGLKEGPDVSRSERKFLKNTKTEILGSLSEASRAKINRFSPKSCFSAIKTKRMGTKTLTNTATSKTEGVQKAATPMQLQGTRTKKIGNVTLQVEVVKDICSAKVDAIVNPANPHLVAGSGVCGRIRDKGGAGIFAECMGHIAKLAATEGRTGLKAGEAMMTSAGKLPPPIKNVIHGVPPRLEKLSNGTYPPPNEAQKKALQEVYYNCLMQAHMAGLSSIMFPSMATGIYGFPVDVAAPLAMAAMQKFATDFPETSLTSITLGAWSQKGEMSQDYKHYAKALDRLDPQKFIDNEATNKAMQQASDYPYKGYGVSGIEEGVSNRANLASKAASYGAMANLRKNMTQKETGVVNGIGHVGTCYTWNVPPTLNAKIPEGIQDPAVRLPKGLTASKYAEMRKKVQKAVISGTGLTPEEAQETALSLGGVIVEATLPFKAGVLLGDDQGDINIHCIYQTGVNLKGIEGGGIAVTNVDKALAKLPEFALANAKAALKAAKGALVYNIGIGTGEFAPFKQKKAVKQANVDALCQAVQDSKDKGEPLPRIVVPNVGFSEEQQNKLKGAGIEIVAADKDAIAALIAREGGNVSLTIAADPMSMLGIHGPGLWWESAGLGSDEERSAYLTPCYAVGHIPIDIYEEGKEAPTKSAALSEYMITP